MNSRTNAVSVGIVADDLTGANDSAVQFARGGWTTRLILGDPAGADAAEGSVVAVVTDSRAQDAEAAHASTSKAIASLITAGIDRLFLKIDSTMRGSVSAQIDGALDAWSAEHHDAIAVVCPAYPAMGRTVEHGRLLVDGDGVETTSVGRDPVTPVTTSQLSELLPGSAAVSIAGLDASALAKRLEELAADGTRVITVDAATDSDVRTIGDAILELGPSAIPVGSAGLAGVMSNTWGAALSSTRDADADADARGTGAAASVPPGRVVVQVSSLHDVSHAQHAHLVDNAADVTVRTFAPKLDEVGGADVAAAWISRELDQQPELPEVVVVLAPTERGSGRTAGGTSDDSASDTGSGTTAERVAAGLAAITDAIISHSSVSALVLMGGEGARAVLDAFDADSILVTDAIREGIPIGVIEGGRLHGLTVVTKAGGFGAPSSLTAIVPELLLRSAAPRTGNH